MTFDVFMQSLAATTPPETTPLLTALWHDARGDWDLAHRLAQDVETADGAWVHAYLHRKEGDIGNAHYWYRRAKRAECRDDLQTEWTLIVTTLLGSAPM